MSSDAASAERPARARAARPRRSSCSPRRSSGPGAVVVDATLGLGGHAEALLAALPAARLVGLDRDTEALALAGERLAAVRRPGHAGARRLRRAARGARRARAATACDGVLFDLGVSSLQLDEADRGLRLRPGRAAGHADGPDRAASPPPRSSTPTRRRARPGAAGVRRGAVRPPDRRRRSSGSASSEPFTTSARLAELVRSVDPGRRPAHRRPPGQAHLPGAADRGQRRAGRLERALPRGGRRARRRRADRRPVLPLARGPDRQAGARRRAPRSTHPAGPAGRAARARADLRLLTRGAEEPSERRGGRQPPPRRSAAAAGRRTHQSHEGTRTA